MEEKKQRTNELILIESFLVYIQKNLDKIEQFFQEVKKCDDLEEQRYLIFRFLLDSFNNNKTAKTRKFKKMMKETGAQRYIQSNKRQLEKQPVKIAIQSVTQLIYDSYIEDGFKDVYFNRLTKIDIKLLETAYQSSTAKITGMDMKYIVCFVAGISVKDICKIFNVEQASVHTTRYRIRKKFAKEDGFGKIL